MKHTLSKFGSKFKASVLLLVLLASSTFAATDFSVLTGDIATDITGLTSAIGPIGASIIGVALLVGVVFLFKGLAKRVG